MAERKAVNKYYPPDWEPSHGSLNHYVKTKGQNNRAHHKNSGIGAVLHDHKVDAKPLTTTTTKRIRFELPMPIWCDSCHRHIAKNVRFNADKRQTGMYHTTPILEFTFTCPSCPQQIVVETVPSETRYRVSSGAQEKTETPDPPDPTTDPHYYTEGTAGEPVSAFAKLEMDVMKRERVDREKPKLEQLVSASERIWQNDFAASQLVRRQFRDRKRRDKRMAAGDPVGAALKRHGIDRIGTDSDTRDTDDSMVKKRKDKTRGMQFTNW